MKPSTILACGLLALVGCEKRQSTTSSAPVDHDSKPVVSANAPAQSVTEKKTEDQTEALLKRLAQAVRRYGVEQQRVPKDLEEVVAQGYLPELPQPPPGKKFAINKNLEVHLVNR